MPTNQDRVERYVQQTSMRQAATPEQSRRSRRVSAHLKLMKESSKCDGDEDDETTPEAKAWAKQIASLNKEMAERMGSLPLRGDQLEPGSDLESGHPGRVSRKGLSLSVDKVSFRDIIIGSGQETTVLERSLLSKGDFISPTGHMPNHGYGVDGYLIWLFAVVIAGWV